jgi:hypothetical protein
LQPIIKILLFPKVRTQGVFIYFYFLTFLLCAGCQPLVKSRCNCDIVELKVIQSWGGGGGLEFGFQNQFPVSGILKMLSDSFVMKCISKSGNIENIQVSLG